MVVWKIIVGLTCLWLMGCSPQDEQQAHFTTYLTRVAHVLEMPAPTLVPPPALTALPAQRTLTIKVPRISSGLLESLKLKRCDLLGLVAEHNAPLGKSQTAAWQFAYHLQFQQQLQHCLTGIAATERLQSSEEQELVLWLQQVVAQKAPQLALYYWNMMVAEPDIRAALSPGSQSLGFTAQAGFQETLHAFQLFARLQQQVNTLSSAPSSYAAPINETEALELKLSQALKGLYKNPYLGQLFYSLHASASYLEQSLAFLTALDNIHCQGPHAIKVQRLRNAMQHYYIKDIQAYLAKLDRQFVELAPLLATSLAPVNSHIEAHSQPMAEYRHQVALGLDSAIYVRYRELTLAHAKVWQDFLTRCEHSPTRS